MSHTPAGLESRQALVISLQIVFVSLACITYLLRLYTRAFILRSAGHDDYIMGIAILLSIALAVNACFSTKFGWGKHLHDLQTSDVSPLLFLTWLSELLFTLATSFVKLSILIFYLRIAVTTTYRRIIYGSIVFISAWAIIFTTIAILQCHPVSAYWDPGSTQCYKPVAALFIHGLTNTLTDVYVFILPMQMVWKTQLPQRQRIGLLVIFGTGFLVCIAGILRLYYSIVTEHSKDGTWVGVNLWIWEAIEVNLGIICASVPCLKALISRIAPGLMSSHGASKMSRTPGAHYQINAGRSADNRDDYALDSMRRAKRERNLLRSSGDSQEGLTKVHPHVLIAQVDAIQQV